MPRIVMAAGPATVPDDDREGFYLELTRTHPQAAEPWFQLGNMYAAQGRLEAAEHAYRQVLARADRPEALHNLGLVLVRMGVVALREARGRLPANDAVQAETRELLQLLLESVP